MANKLARHSITQQTRTQSYALKAGYFLWALGY